MVYHEKQLRYDQGKTSVAMIKPVNEGVRGVVEVYRGRERIWFTIRDFFSSSFLLSLSFSLSVYLSLCIFRVNVTSICIVDQEARMRPSRDRFPAVSVSYLNDVNDDAKRAHRLRLIC